MSGKKRGPKPRYEEEDVLETMAVYFYEHMVVRKEDLSVFTMDAIYDDIQHDASQSILYRNVAFPKYSRMRKMLIDHLSAYGLYQEKERLTAAVVRRAVKKSKSCVWLGFFCWITRIGSLVLVRQYSSANNMVQCSPSSMMYTFAVTGFFASTMYVISNCGCSEVWCTICKPFSSLSRNTCK